MPLDRGAAELDAERVAAQDRYLRALLARLGADSHLADDLAQETWLALLRQSAASVFLQRAWLGTVARNFLLQSVRGAGRRRAREQEFARAAVPQSDDPSLDEGLRQRLLAAVARLEEPYQTVIRLRFFEDLPPTLIAERLGVAVETVRTRLKRGLLRVHADLVAGR